MDNSSVAYLVAIYFLRQVLFEPGRNREMYHRMMSTWSEADSRSDIRHMGRDFTCRRLDDIHSALPAHSIGIDETLVSAFYIVTAFGSRGPVTGSTRY